MSGYPVPILDDRQPPVVLRVQVQVPEFQVYVTDVRGGQGIRGTHDQSRRRRHFGAAFLGGDSHRRPSAFHGDPIKNPWGQHVSLIYGRVTTKVKTSTATRLTRLMLLFDCTDGRGAGIVTSQQVVTLSSPHHIPPARLTWRSRASSTVMAIYVHWRV